MLEKKKKHTSDLLLQELAVGASSDHCSSEHKRNAVSFVTLLPHTFHIQMILFLKTWAAVTLHTANGNNPKVCLEHEAVLMAKLIHDSII